MQAFNSQTAIICLRSDKLVSLRASILMRQGAEAPPHNPAFSTAMLRRLPWAEADIVARHDGCGWNNSTERPLAPVLSPLYPDLRAFGGGGQR
jgi:hypothetical protein